ncbi:hypothetical protein SRABI27_03907 [Pedobacter sp. Bi27]|nr:hypothetical protein SRABI36_00025 [Pedobacter sp. Bi36]CAH0175419.1 hypothetical protein SRABI126_01123 [Pedobacter sp. Bi126]CAH0285374.1 hypothetical protein SRABI27_03907 [Pedobacter sp. Bi27]
MRSQVAIVVRLLRRLKKPSRHDDSSHPIATKNAFVIYFDVYTINTLQDNNVFCSF